VSVVVVEQGPVDIFTYRIICFRDRRCTVVLYIYIYYIMYIVYSVLYVYCLCVCIYIYTLIVGDIILLLFVRMRPRAVPTYIWVFFVLCKRQRRTTGADRQTD